MRAKDFDKKFDEGQDISAFLELESAERQGYAIKRINVDFPAWMISLMDKESQRLGVTRQSIIKIWIAEKLKEVAG